MPRSPVGEPYMERLGFRASTAGTKMGKFKSAIWGNLGNPRSGEIRDLDLSGWPLGKLPEFDREFLPAELLETPPAEYYTREASPTDLMGSFPQWNWWGSFPSLSGIGGEASPPI